MQSSVTPRIGFIGLGIMGKPMVQNLMKAGYTVTVYNRSQTAVSELVSKGANGVMSPKQVAAGSDVIIDMVTDAPDVEDVLLHENGVIQSAREGSVVIDMSTNSPGTAKYVARELEKKKISFLDAPVTGGDKGAREGTLTIMVGGPKEIFDRCLPIFQVLGKEIVHMGVTGSGQATKLCNQTAVAINALATCEALMLGAAYDLPSNSLLRVLGSGAASSWSLNYLGPRIISNDFEPGFKASHLQKDLKYVLRVAAEKHLSLLGSGLLEQLYNGVVAEGYGEKGTQVLIKTLQQLSGSKQQ